MKYRDIAREYLQAAEIDRIGKDHRDITEALLGIAYALLAQAEGGEQNGTSERTSTG